MNKYTETELKERLLECDYPNNQKLIVQTVNKIKNFGAEAGKMFEYWYSTSKVNDFDIKGITPSYLRKHHKMKDVGIIIAFDWLNKKSDEAAHLLKKNIVEKKFVVK